MLLAEIDGALDDLQQVEIEALGRDELHELVVGLHAVTARVEAVKARAIARWDSRQTWAEDGSRAAGARLAREARLSRREANAAVRRARDLRSMPHTAGAFGGGELSADHVDALARVNQPHVAELFARDEAMLVGEAQKLTFEQFQRVLRYWLLNADPDGDRGRAEAERRRRYLQLARTFYGGVDVRGFLDPVSGAAVRNEHQRLMDELFKEDVAEARTRLDRDSLSVSDLARTAAQRAADALVLMAERSRACPANSRRPEPLVTVVVDYETFTKTLCELEDGTVIGPNQLLPLLGRADIERVVFGTNSRVLDVGVRERFFAGALRRAIQVRDRHCQHPSGCTVAADRCEVDHVIPYAEGGLTTQTNGRLYCGPHNRARNKTPTAIGALNRESEPVAITQ